MQMRRKDREMKTREDMVYVLDTCKVMRIGMYDKEGIYILPLNYGYTYEGDELVFYFHSAKEGKKLNLIAECGNVGFELDCDHELTEGKIACEYGYRFASLVGKGVAQIVYDPGEKADALGILMKCQTGREFPIDEKMAAMVSVIKVTATEFAGKRRK